MQIHVESPGDDGFIVVCLSEGWFPQPRMEWRGSQGEVVPYSSISHSQDGDRFFHTKMTLLLRNQSQESITCCVLNPLTGEEKQTNLILASEYSVMRDCQLEAQRIKQGTNNCQRTIALQNILCLCLFFLITDTGFGKTDAKCTV